MNGKKILILLVGILVILGACFGTFKIITNGDDVENKENINTQKNSGDSENKETEKEKEKEEKFIIGEREAIFTNETYPRIDGSTATIPLSEAFKAEFLGIPLSKAEVEHNTTHYAYENLISGDADLILVTYPSDEELELAKKAGVEFEIIPVVNEAFVFYNNINNPVSGLSLEQIQNIYTGAITNWKDVGGNDAKIKAFQREPNSGSQTGMIKLVMKGKKLMEPLTENIIEDMLSIIGLVSDYDNGVDSIGYSYYYYATTMYDIIDKTVTDRIRLLAVDGVEPNNQTIKDGTYPLRTNYYIVINKAEKEDSPTRKLVEAMLGEYGQKAAEKVGYVGM